MNTNFPDYKKARVSDLVPYANNARTHSPEQVAQIARSIQEFGFMNPVIVDDEGGVIAGHGRILAAQSLGMTEVPCVEANWLTEDQKKAYVLADNQIATNSGWDLSLLRVEIADLTESGFDIPILGFTDDFLKELAAEPTLGLVDPDECGPLPAIARTKEGDVWVLGKHRIMCGDATSADSVAKLLDGAKPHIMVTDPPYGVDYDPEWRKRAGLQEGGSYGVVANDTRADWSDAWRLFPGNVAYVWHGALHSTTVIESLASAGFLMKSSIVWVKNRPAIGRGHYHWKHEPCIEVQRASPQEGDDAEFAAYATKGGSARWVGGRAQTTVWEIAVCTQHSKGEDAKVSHSTQKPVECMKRPLRNNSTPGDAVYEPFSGSGTTIIACEELGRVCYAMELMPEYVDMAVERWQRFTGKEAIHEDGRRFNDVKATA